MIDYGVKDIRTLEGIEAIRLRPGITPLKYPYCKKPMNLIGGYLTLSHWLCKKCKKEYEFDGNIERIVGELPANARLLMEYGLVSPIPSRHWSGMEN